MFGAAAGEAGSAGGVGELGVPRGWHLAEQRLQLLHELAFEIPHSSSNGDELDSTLLL